MHGISILKISKTSLKECKLVTQISWILCKTHIWKFESVFTKHIPVLNADNILEYKIILKLENI